MHTSYKIQKIISAIKSGVSIYKIDPVGHGNAAKVLLKSKQATQRKVNQMYENVLRIEKQKAQTFNPEAYDNESAIVNEKVKLEKITTIIEADHAGMPKKAIDPVSNGGSLKLLVDGGIVTPGKLDQMYENVIKFQQKELALKKKLTLLLPHNPEKPDYSEKVKLILKAIQLGVKKSKIGSGRSLKKLQEHKKIQKTEVNTMYFNLLDFLGYTYKSEDLTLNSSVSAPQELFPKQTFPNELQNFTQEIISKDATPSLHTNIQ